MARWGSGISREWIVELDDDIVSLRRMGGDEPIRVIRGSRCRFCTPFNYLGDERHKCTVRTMSQHVVDPGRCWCWLAEDMEDAL